MTDNGIYWEKRCVESEKEVASLRHRIEIDTRLYSAGAIDMETARLLTEAFLGDMDSPDISVAVNTLRNLKPFLFHQTSKWGIQC